MILSLTGVLDDGSIRAEGSSVPYNPRQALAFQLGTSLTVRVRVVTPDGNPVIGGTVKLTVKKRAGDSSPALPAKSAALTPSVDLSITPADTKSLEPGRYAYDIWHQAAETGPGLNDGARNAVVPLSPLWLEPAATLP